MNLLKVCFLLVSVGICLLLDSRKESDGIQIVQEAVCQVEIDLTKPVVLTDSENKNSRDSNAAGDIHWIGNSCDWTEGFFY